MRTETEGLDSSWLQLPIWPRDLSILLLLVMHDCKLFTVWDQEPPSSLHSCGSHWWLWQMEQRKFIEGFLLLLSTIRAPHMFAHGYLYRLQPRGRNKATKVSWGKPLILPNKRNPNLHPCSFSNTIIFKYRKLWSCALLSNLLNPA